MMNQQEEARPRPDPLSVTLYSVSEAANILGVSERTVYRWVREGDLPTKRIGPAGRLIRITGEDLEAFINTDFSEGEGV